MASQPDAGPTGAQQVALVRGDSRTLVTLRTEPIRDGCSLAVATEVLRERRPAAKACGEDYARRHGAAPKGRVVLALSLDPSGDPAQIAVVTDDVGDDALRACLIDAVDGPFPNPLQRRCVVQAPFDFRAPRQ